MNYLNFPLQEKQLLFFKCISIVFFLSIFFISHNAVLADDEITFEKGIISFTFDDGWKSAYDALDNGVLGDYVGTMYVSTSELKGATEGGGIYYTGYMSEGDLLNLYEKGFEIGSHTRSHVDLTTVNDDSPRLLGEVIGSRLDLLEPNKYPGSEISNFAYPYGGVNSSIVESLKLAGYVGARTVDPSSLNFKNTDPFLLNATQINNNTSIGDVKEKIGNAISEKGWLIFVIHEVNDVCGSNLYCTTPGFIEDVVEYIKGLESNGVDVVTIERGLELMGYQAESDEISINQENISVYTNGIDDEGVFVEINPEVSTENFSHICSLDDTLIETREAEEDKNNGSGVYFEKVIGSGYIFPVGDTKVTCAIVNQKGEIEETNFTVTVKNPTLLSVNADVENKNYDGNPSAEVILELSNVIEGDDVTVGYEKAFFSDYKVGEEKEVTVTGLYLLGADAEKYRLSEKEIFGVASINKKGVSVVAVGKDKNYDGNPSAEVILELSNVIEGDDVTVGYEKAFFSDSKVGEEKEVTITGLYLSGAGADMYEILSGDLKTNASIKPITDDNNEENEEKNNNKVKRNGGRSISSGVKVEKDEVVLGEVLGESTSTVSQIDEELMGDEKHSSQEGGSEASVSFVFARNLQIGSAGDDVVELQKRLRDEGVYSGPITGYYGELTFAGVINYQAKYKIQQVGIVGPITRQKLNSLVVNDGVVVSELQKKLELLEKLQELRDLLILLKSLQS